MWWVWSFCLIENMQVLMFMVPGGPGGNVEMVMTQHRWDTIWSLGVLLYDFIGFGQRVLLPWRAPVLGMFQFTIGSSPVQDATWRRRRFFTVILRIAHCSTG
jgi:hypothetical protein